MSPQIIDTIPYFNVNSKKESIFALEESVKPNKFFKIF